ncbi:MAG: redox-sensing transcriptional repressor Rex [Gemmataceae bacterium]
MKTAPLPTVRRLPIYLTLLRRFQGEGHVVISGTRIAEELGLESIQVRKDLAYTGIVGKPRVGFDLSDSIHLIESYLGWDQATRAVLVGAGSLGTALLGYRDFTRHGLEIIAVCDSDMKKVGKTIHGQKLYPMDRLGTIVRQKDITLGILTVPAAVAQRVADQLVEAGIVAIWNFAPIALKVPENVLLQNTELSVDLAVLSVMLKQNDATATTEEIRNGPPSKAAS